MNIAIHQPNFIPWLGYFNKIKAVDKFVFFDDVQFERGKTLTSRVKILVQGNENWLTVPVMDKTSLSDIKDVRVDETFIWKKKHLRTIELSYKKAPYFDEIFPIIAKIYSNSTPFLIDYNIELIKIFCEYLEIKTEFVLSSEQRACADKQGFEKIFCIIQNLKANEYTTGSGAGSKRYINEDAFTQNKINIIWQKYPLTSYGQFNVKTEFIPYLSIIDVLFNHGKGANKYL